MKKLLIHPPVEAKRLKKIEEAAGDRLRVVNAGTPEQALAEVADAEGFFGKMTPPLLAAAGRLEWVQSPTASLEHYIFPALVEHPCVLTNMRGLYSDVIAEQVMGYILCFTRNLHLYIRRQIGRRYEPIGGEHGRSGFETGPAELTPMFSAHRQMRDQTLGVVGLGAIGSEIARLGLAFGMRVVAADPVQTTGPAGIDAIYPSAGLPDLLAESDFVVIAAPHTPETEKLFRRPLFRQMKREAVLINIGRGAIVDLGDLTAALEAGEIAGAALDVYEIEPLPADHPLWGMENVILTPHVAGYSPHIPERHLSVLLENVRRFAAGDPLLNVTRKDQWF